MGRYLSHDQRGFTLIELLIVVAIIGILAAVAVANLITSQRRARYARAAGDTKTIITQAAVVTSDYNPTPITGLGFPAGNPNFLWTQPVPAGAGAGLPQLPQYMANVTDPWALPGVTYRFAEVAPPGGGVIESGNVVFTSRTAGANGNDDSGPLWNGQNPPGVDDLGNSTLIGCALGNAVGIQNPC